MVEMMEVEARVEKDSPENDSAERQSPKWKS